jgi:uncharacterized membrane protein
MFHHLLAPVIILIAALPLIAGIVPPNCLYGVRTKHTRQDKRQWYLVNRIGGIAMSIAACVTIVGVQFAGNGVHRAFVLALPVATAAIVTALVDEIIWRRRQRKGNLP